MVLASTLLATTILAGVPSAAHAQDSATPAEEAVQPTPVPAPAPAAGREIIRSITVNGSQRLEPDTIRSYMKLRVGQRYSQQAADQALKDLFATELFGDVSIRNNQGAVVITVQENPVINRVILEGNKRLKDEKILPEIRLSPRQIFTRTKVRADVARIIELYKRQGRFAATVEPKMVQQDQNRVDVVFEINEGPRSKVQQINIIGNEIFSDGQLRSEMVTKQSRFFRFFSSADTYDPDKLAFDQQKLRQFYLTEGYADFRVVSAVAELTPDKRDFIITYVVEEGERYNFGDVTVESELREFDGETLQNRLRMKSGDPYNAKLVEDTVEQISETAGLFGYAFADVRPQFRRDKESLTMNINFLLADTDRVYIERVDINGNTLTQDKVVRREFRLTEGDAFNSFQVRRSANRINSLGFFQENLEVDQKEGSQADRIILEANVQERPTGELQLSAGISSIENFILQASIRQRNFRGKGQTLGLAVDYSQFRNSVQLSFTEPYLFDRNISVGADIFRRDLNSFNFNNQNNTLFEQLTTGGTIRVGAPLNEFLSLLLNYRLAVDEVSVDESQFFSDIDGDGDTECNPVQAGFFLCDALGSRTTSSIGYSLIYDDRNNRIRPTRGQNFTISQDFAGLGGSVRFLRTRINAGKFWNVGGGFIFSLQAEGGHIQPFENRGSEADGIDDVRLIDRFFLGQPQFRGFDIRGVGPRVIRVFPSGLDRSIADDGSVVLTPNLTNRRNFQDDALGGRSYYFARAELEIPLGSGAQELGLRPSLFVDVGSVFDVVQPILQSPQRTIQSDTGELQPVYLTVNDEGNIIETFDAVDANGNPNTPDLAFQELFLGDSISPRITAGIGVNWNSPFGPFRIDFAYDVRSQVGDDTRLITFNVGTQF
ncbi:outer membrane protein assembly factor BamA [Alterisphingorhabdus coralli]|uniref:Outer membrane protein assembly factor BamA n=1 Tax=Alterisphingorhabdus coralli TaxID=3071408 RepID=A0AA97FAL9_9SPHN|nr:outer membrane protein assembly factor BamA [Parasphingorhabdus sp. SCSIO 66989]WOE76641.1 outer membrane protein assembly factor BamA [Parasphingorhabdus sp. SCSIO 66989]